MQMNREKLSPVFFIPALLVAVLFGLLRSGEPARTEEQVAPRLEVFLNAREVEVFSLDPLPWPIAQKRYGPGFAELYDYPVLGRVVISDAAEVTTIRAAVRDLDRAAKAWSGGVASCFDPRHCLRVTTTTGTHDLLICYACCEVHIFDGTRRLDGLLTATDNPDQAATPDKLNALLKKHAVPLAKAPK